MLNPTDLETIKKTVEEFFTEFGFQVEVSVSPEKEGNVPIDIKTEEAQVLIGQDGQILTEIQYLLKAILRKKIAEPFYINVDINGYKQKKYSYLQELAQSLADEVALSKEEKELIPMSAQERRVIHLELANRQDVVTDSLGEGTDRRVVILPRESKGKEEGTPSSNGQN